MSSVCNICSSLVQHWKWREGFACRYSSYNVEKVVGKGLFFNFYIGGWRRENEHSKIVEKFQRCIKFFCSIISNRKKIEWYYEDSHISHMCEYLQGNYLIYLSLFWIILIFSLKSLIIYNRASKRMKFLKWFSFMQYSLNIHFFLNTLYKIMSVIFFNHLPFTFQRIKNITIVRALFRKNETNGHFWYERCSPVVEVCSFN